jgi:hypothetical protein
MDESALRDLTDEQFLGYLRATGGRMTLNIITEVARRGSHVLDAEPDLRDGWDLMMRNLAAGLKQFGDSMAKLHNEINATFAGVTLALTALAERVSTSVAAMDLGGSASWAAARRLIPSNLLDRSDLEQLLAVARVDGIAVCWVPRAEILDELRAASTTSQRYDVLVARREDVLDDCDRVLGSVRSPIADQCRSAVACARGGFDGPAQSHATNVFDSIVWGRYDRPSYAKRVAGRTREESTMLEFFEIMAIAPVVATHAHWDRYGPSPGTFNRNGTAHDIGNADAHHEGFVIAALMAATSLVRHFADSEDEALR